MSAGGGGGGGGGGEAQCSTHALCRPEIFNPLPVYLIFHKTQQNDKLSKHSHRMDINSPTSPMNGRMSIVSFELLDRVSIFEYCSLRVNISQLALQDDDHLYRAISK